MRELATEPPEGFSFSRVMPEILKPALVAGSSDSGGGEFVTTAGAGAGCERAASRFFARFSAYNAPTRPRARTNTAISVQTMVLRERAGCSDGAARSSSVGFPQWGQSVTRPMGPAGD